MGHYYAFLWFYYFSITFSHSAIDCRNVVKLLFLTGFHYKTILNESLMFHVSAPEKLPGQALAHSTQLNLLPCPHNLVEYYDSN